MKEPEELQLARKFIQSPASEGEVGDMVRALVHEVDQLKAALGIYEGRRIIMSLGTYYQLPKESSLPLVNPITLPDCWYTTAVLDDGRELAIRGPFVHKIRAENALLDMKPGDFIQEGNPNGLRFRGANPRRKGGQAGLKPGRLPGAPGGQKWRG
jgi:hypothetical protein